MPQPITLAPAAGAELQFSWGQWPLQFEVRSGNEELIARAGAILRFWQDANAAQEKIAWQVVGGADEFQILQGERCLTKCQNINQVIRNLECMAALELLERTEHILSVHGAMLARGGNGVLIVGPSEAGKSTLSCAMWRAGWTLLSDDVTVISPETADAAPVLRRVSLRHPSRKLLGEELWEQITSCPSSDPTSEGWVFHPEEIRGCSRAASATLRAIVFLNRRGAEAEAGKLKRIEPAHALVALLPYTNLIRKTDFGVAMLRLEPLFQKIAAYDLARGPLDGMIECVESLLESSN